MPSVYGGRLGADSLSSPGDGRIGAAAWPKRRATRHDAGSARSERIEREEEMGARTRSSKALKSGRLGALLRREVGCGKEERKRDTRTGAEGDALRAPGTQAEGILIYRAECYKICLFQRPIYLLINYL